MCSNLIFIFHLSFRNFHFIYYKKKNTFWDFEELFYFFLTDKRIFFSNRQNKLIKYLKCAKMHLEKKKIFTLKHLIFFSDGRFQIFWRKTTIYALNLYVSLVFSETQFSFTARIQFNFISFHFTLWQNGILYRKLVKIFTGMKERKFCRNVFELKIN